jgi:hypothetical protein
MVNLMPWLLYPREGALYKDMDLYKDVTAKREILTAIGWPPGGSSSVHIYAQTIQRMTQNKQYIEQHKNTWNNTKNT